MFFYLVGERKNCFFAPDNLNNLFALKADTYKNKEKRNFEKNASSRHFEICFRFFRVPA